MADLTALGSCTLSDDGCTTCGDVGVPVRVVALGTDGFADVEDRLGQHADIAIAFTPDVRPGDVLLVHMGVAIAHLLP